MQRRNVILPNFITLLGLLAGVYSIVAVMDGKYATAGFAIIVAGIFDGLDGKVARLINGTSEFGVQLDSLADLVSFGVAPAILIYKWQLSDFGKVGIMAMFLFAACGALRLARFNIQSTKKVDNTFFSGLPIPAAAAVIASGAIFLSYLGISNAKYLPILSLIMVFLLAFLMVSTLPYFSFKKMGFVKRKPFNSAVVLVVFLFIVGLEPAVTIFAIILLYTISGVFTIPMRNRLLNKNKTNKAS